MGLKLVIVFICGLIIGIVGGFIGHKIALRNRTADGTCIRLLDGEVYLKLSEAGQRKLADPKTEQLCLSVISPDWKPLDTRNIRPL